MGGNMETSIDKEILEVISTNLRHLRNNTKIIKNNRQRIMTQTEIAKFLGVSYQQYSKYETSINKVNAINLYKISKFFGVDVNTIYDKEFVKSKFEKTIIKV
jgi:transcriptional regulator with XRE-family HTH domain